MIKEFKPGGLYRCAPNHHHYQGCSNLTFLCTKPMVASYKKVEEGLLPAYVLINVDDAGFWTHDPDPNIFDEVPL